MIELCERKKARALRVNGGGGGIGLGKCVRVG